jgi:hypothetical protein
MIRNGSIAWHHPHGISLRDAIHNKQEYAKD